MKPNRIKLETLKVKSFVTNLNVNKTHTIHGGVDTLPTNCPPTTITVDTANCVIVQYTMEAHCMGN